MTQTTDTQVTELADRVRQAPSREAARAALTGHPAALVRAVADHVGAAYGAGWSRAKIIDSVVQVAVGFKITSRAILGR